ncbi:MAG: proton-conducting transporter membrane subunit [Bacteroidota bacterium]
MNDLDLLLSSVVFAAAGMILLPFLKAQTSAFVHFLFVLLIALVTSIPAFHALSGSPVDATIFGTAFFGEIQLRVDALSAWFMLIVNFTCLTGAWYGKGYMKPYASKNYGNLKLHWTFFLLFQTSMLWVCMLQHSLAFLVAWELMSLSSLLLVIFEHQKKSTLKAGVNYLVQMHVGVVFLTVGFVWLYFSEGSFSFEAAGSFFREHRNVWLFLLLFVGFGIKAGFIPLHSWLPHAHPAAPSHVSGVMSGVIVKLGIYGILRFALLLENDLLLIGETLLALSLLTGIFGILNAAVYRDFKKMLAYCTIENIGIIGAGIGLFLIGRSLGNPFLTVIGLTGALLHVLNHSLFKSLLFFSAGSVYQQTHTREIEKLGGLIKKMPQTAILFLTGALAIGGLPPFNGFVSEFLLYTGFLEGVQISKLNLSVLMMLSLAALALIGGLSLMTFTKNFGVIFLGNPRSDAPEKAVEVSLAMRFPQYLIVGVMLCIGLFPQVFFAGAWQVATSALPASLLPDASVLTNLTALTASVGRFSLLFLLLAGLVFFARNYFAKKRPVASGGTWGCGYVAPSAASMQYTGKSYSKTLGKLLAFLVKEEKRYPEISPAEIFPEKRRYASHYKDFFEANILSRLTEKLVSGMNYFQFIQNGRIQAYVLYGVFFIVLIFLGTVLDIL